MALGCGNSILACQGRRDDGGPLRRCYLKGRVGDAANVALSAWATTSTASWLGYLCPLS